MPSGFWPFWDAPLWEVFSGVFRGKFGASRTRFFFFVFCIVNVLFLQLCVKQLRILKVKMKTLFERCYFSFCQIIHWWRYFLFLNILCEIFCKFLCFFVGLLYTLLINNLLITTTDTYRLYIYPIHFTVTNNESVIVIIIKDRLVV